MGKKKKAGTAFAVPVKSSVPHKIIWDEHDALLCDALPLRRIAVKSVHPALPCGIVCHIARDVIYALAYLAPKVAQLIRIHDIRVRIHTEATLQNIREPVTTAFGKGLLHLVSVFRAWLHELFYEPQHRLVERNRLLLPYVSFLSCHVLTDQRFSGSPSK